MSFLIDEDAVRKLLEERAGNAYTVTASNLRVSPVDSPSNPVFSMGVSGTTVSVLMQPHMSLDTIGKLHEIRQRIVASGTHLMTTEELDSEISERKRQLPGD